MKKIVIFLFFALITMSVNAQHLCQVHYNTQNPPNSLQVWFMGDAWNTDNTPINVTHWEWSFGDGSSATTRDPNHIYQQAGTYNVCLYISTSDGCTTHYCDSITVGQIPQNCQAMISQQTGNNNDIYFNGYATNGNGGTLNVLSYYWTFGDGTEATTRDPHHTYSHAGSYRVCLRIITADSCISTTCETYTVSSNLHNCVTNFSYQNSPNSLIVLFHGHAWNTDNTPINVTSYSWSFGDGVTSTGINPDHRYNHAGSYRVCLEIHTSNGCVSFYCDSVHIGQIPQPNCIPTYNYSRDSSNLSVLTYNFMASSGSLINNTTRWEWSFGDGTSSTLRNPQHTYNHAGWYNICVHVSDSLHQCFGVFCDSINIGGQQNIPCQSRFSFQTNQQTNEVHFYGYDQGNPNYPNNITSFYWTFGDGTEGTTRDPNHIYYHPGFYYVCLTITTNNNCTSTYCDSIEIAPIIHVPCQANWSAYPNSNVNCIYCYTFIDMSSANNIVSREWTFDDGTTSNNRQVIHTFNHPGRYHVCLTINTADSCTSTYCNYVEIDSVNIVPNNCSMYVTFTTTPSSLPAINDGAIDLSVHSGLPPYRFEWSNGATTEDISGLSRGYYTLEVHDFLNCVTHARIHVGSMLDSLNVINTLLNGAIDTCINFPYQDVRVYNIRFISNTTIEVTWIFEGNGICSFISETYQVSQNGTYIVGISIHCGTKSLETYYDYIYVNDLLGVVDNVMNSEIRLFPNPVNDVLNIQMSIIGERTAKIALINIYGQIIFEESASFSNGAYKIPTSNLSNGLYIVKITLDNNAIVTAKFIK